MNIHIQVTVCLTEQNDTCIGCVACIYKINLYAFSLIVLDHDRARPMNRYVMPSVSVFPWIPYYSFIELLNL